MITNIMFWINFSDCFEEHVMNIPAHRFIYFVKVKFPAIFFLHSKFGWKGQKGSKTRSFMYSTILLLHHRWAGQDASFEKSYISYQRMLCVKFGWNWPYGSEEDVEQYTPQIVIANQGKPNFQKHILLQVEMDVQSNCS